ncbi:5-formyltetrahydrofolate cyclo-ligase [Sphingopyxis sp. H071]|nr:MULTISPECIES: 5-formyltetrahydrofolate cyclo-ligase [unclassified Sphingopyxis]KTE23217.1 5-formyltetrahydrofolate cyclo-ligase [Sphingopyxis sp. H057]KTE49453.1 5-formyltetrahydrofolate cyclo-ligase [Sphingopyxis sp. H073]KTE63226.1 5-formyltetrahydrofolate cyclo-ligase [Sphingopyxis sp. H100]KTE77330.1 5-formyltetrahydrofolate cyclo-ligase [Sphingopyxis sp. H067]KTE50111.1 5-formyltetrahydrofolate cyclo-ligase [Sphingopyxis sp. H071]
MTDRSDSLSNKKNALRDKLRFRCKHFAANLDPLARFAAFRSLPAPLADLTAAARCIAAYIAWRDEPDILPMLTGVQMLALPHHAGRVDTMSFRHWRPGDALERGPWGTEQPEETGESVVPDLIFCPLLGFDRAGGRLGQGGGHYDRYFAAHPGIPRIGIAWSVQEVDTVPTEPTDARLDAILTEQEFIVTGDRL